MAKVEQRHLDAARAWADAEIREPRGEWDHAVGSACAAFRDACFHPVTLAAYAQGFADAEARGKKGEP